MRTIVVNRKNLTRQESVVLSWIPLGKTSWEIGQIMGITERTVTAHIVNMAAKLDAVNRTHLISIAICNDILVLAKKEDSKVFDFIKPCRDCRWVK